jgi:hypothetical protein
MRGSKDFPLWEPNKTKGPHDANAVPDLRGLNAWQIAVALRFDSVNFTNHCEAGFGLTLQPFRRRLLLLRGKLAVAAVALSAPNTRWRYAPFKSRSIRWRPDMLAPRMPRETRLKSQQVKPANREVPEWKKPHRIVSRASPDAEPRPGLKTRTSAYNPNRTMGESP